MTLEARKKSLRPYLVGKTVFGPRPFHKMSKISIKFYLGLWRSYNFRISHKMLFRPRGTMFSLTTKRFDNFLRHFSKIFREIFFFENFFCCRIVQNLLKPGLHQFFSKFFFWKIFVFFFEKNVRYQKSKFLNFVQF